MITKPLDKNTTALLICLVGFNLIAHTASIPIWLTAFSGIFIVWRAYYLYKGWALPSRLITGALALTGVALIFAEYKTLLGLEPATAILAYVAALKLLETMSYRDTMLVLFNCYFLLMAHLLGSQSLLSTIYMGLDLLLITAIIFHLHKRDRRTSVRSFRPAMKMLFLALPVWMLLFVAFPRFSTELFRITKENAPSTGFSDNLAPGQVEQLVNSDEPVFRVRFIKGEAPNNLDLYWRGAVLTIAEDGLRWSKRPDFGGSRLQKDDSATIDQEITLEPLHQKWLFALDVPAGIQFQEDGYNRLLRDRGDAFFETKENIHSRLLYTASSRLHFRTNLSESERAMNLQVPKTLSPLVLALAERLRQNTANELELSRHVLDFYARENFRYTKLPGLQRGDLDEFLFEKKRGFCEHYAASYAILMRLMKVPARVVIGFQGGLPNEFGSYLLVRSLEAHAWAEIFVEAEHRWIRVDPTATIAPLRLTLGGDYNRIDPTSLAGITSKEELHRLLDGAGWFHFQLRINSFLDSVTTSWNSFMLKYDYDFQISLLERLGLEKGGRLILFIWIAVGAVIFFIGLQWSLRRKALREDPILQYYHVFCRKFESAGLSRRATEGPVDFSNRLISALPGQAQEIKNVFGEFLSLRYQNLNAKESKAHLKDFKNLVRNFKARRFRT